MIENTLKEKGRGLTEELSSFFSEGTEKPTKICSGPDSKSVPQIYLSRAPKQYSDKTFSAFLISPGIVTWPDHHILLT
jgi:hypothetical protein